ncbi:group II intron reverse transcriptase/maturase [Bacillus pacificus]|nr:reverse transcriptase domain-containing protein [Bacillus cereus]AJG56725.1 type II intron maturase family protein [Bacillus cereus D17]AYY25184.1 group II intron reverse transcriptase/maturase [Bacillus sp. FDAARGOS_527]MCC2352159.1 group II intron reverse transcriptase/maturase [Bacillus pacificus]MCC2427592.1 group II intron reverse transcriptase/maturase [Bacillus paranthracis]KMP65632.1 maturase [Bacillus cereus]
MAKEGSQLVHDDNKQEGSEMLMRNPVYVLNTLSKNTIKENYKFKRLYRNLYNPEFYYKGYQEIYANPGNMTRGTINNTVDGFSKNRVSKIINNIKNGNYKPTPVKRVYIDKKGSKKKRPLGVPTFDDKLVQLVIKYILEAIYEPNFSENSHGFRKNRGCHTALKQIKKSGNGTKWFIEGDIQGFFDNIDHHILIDLLRKRINDETLIGLIWKFLRAGYMEDWQFHKTFSGTPQGGILSPLLANIYLNELDIYMEKYAEKFGKGQPKDREVDKRYQYLHLKIKRGRKKADLLREQGKHNEAQELIKQVNEWVKERGQRPYYNPMSDKFKSLKYVRYADDFIVMIIGSKDDAKAIKSDIAQFLNEELKLTLSEEKTLITHSSKKATFLGYNVNITRNELFTKYSVKGAKRRHHNLKVRLEIPHEAWRNKLLALNVLEMKYVNGKETWKPKHRPEMAHLDDLEILHNYVLQIRGMYNYYKYAVNSTVLQKFSYVLEYSMYKTFANKYKSSIGKIKGKYCKNGVFIVNYKDKKGKQHSHSFYREGFRTVDITKMKTQENNIDNLLASRVHMSTTSLMDRLSANKCEHCGKTDSNLVMHHVRKMKDVEKGKAKWQKLMIARRRKTLAVCEDCHNEIHYDMRVELIAKNRKK